MGHRHIVDATLQEKACSVASLIMSVTHKGTITCTRKVGGGSLDPESIFEMTEVSTDPWPPPQPTHSLIYLLVDLQCKLSDVPQYHIIVYEQGL